MIAGACAMAARNIVDAQIYTTSDGLALDTIAVTREFDRDDDEARRAGRITEAIEKALVGELKLPEGLAKRKAGRNRALTRAPAGSLGSTTSGRMFIPSWKSAGLTGPASFLRTHHHAVENSISISRRAHVATFGERVVDVFMWTDLLGSKISARRPARPPADAR